MLEKLFKLKDNRTTVQTEVVAGFTTFMTMAYILAVNPGILSVAGMDSGAVFTATALASALALGLALSGVMELLPAQTPALGCLALAALTAALPPGRDK